MCILMCLAFYFSCRTDCMAFGFHSTKCQISPLVGDWLQWAQWTLFPHWVSYSAIRISLSPQLQLWSIFTPWSVETAYIFQLSCFSAQYWICLHSAGFSFSQVFLATFSLHTWENMIVVERREERRGCQDLLLPFALIMELYQVFSRCTIQIDFPEPCLRPL